MPIAHTNIVRQATLALALTATSLLVLPGCEKTADYRYISLLESMNVTELGQAELEVINNQRDMPIAYVLDRPEYTVVAELDLLSVRPAAFFSAQSKLPSSRLTIRGESIRCAALFENLAVDGDDALSSSVPTARFMWAPQTDGPCSNRELPDRVIRFDVVDSKGNVIGQEALQFSIEKNGEVKWVEGL